MKGMIFDLDGTLVDSVHAHVLSWQNSMNEFGISVDAASIHRRIGMSGKLLIEECAREAGSAPSSDEMAGMDALHSSIFEQLSPQPRPLRGAKELLRHLKAGGIRCGIATSGKRPDIDSSLASLELPKDFTIVDASDAKPAKPEPDLFLECQKRLGVGISDCFVVGDSVWDMLAARRAGILGIGLLCGGSSEDDLYRACAFRVYAGPAQLQSGLRELGFP
jgi:HAD superfamily hydrolase (TIGR01509 family)